MRDPRERLSIGSVGAIGLATVGCAAQLDGGLDVVGAERAVHPSVGVGVTVLQQRRAHGVYGAGRAAYSDPEHSGSTGLRHLTVGGGYRGTTGRFAWEAGPELGLGQPTFGAYRGTGFLFGGTSALLWRPLGRSGNEPGFFAVAPLFDVMLAGRGGAWAPPNDAGDRTAVGAFSVHLGVRVSVASDVTVPDGEEQEGASEWGQ